MTVLDFGKPLGALFNNKKKQTNVNKIRINNKDYNNPSYISNSLNDFFCNIGQKLSDKFKDHPDKAFKKYMNEDGKQSMYMARTNESEVLKLINNLDDKKSSGHDEFSAKFLKLCAPYISAPLATIFNKSISSGIYPDLLKIARVSPIHKKGNKLDPNNYRPIIVLSIINKLFEKILHTRIYDYLTKFNIIYEFQFGFRKGHSKHMH